MTHTNTGASKYHCKICDKCYLLPWCKLQTHGHFLIEIGLHHTTFGGNPGAGSAQTWPLPGHVASLRHVTKRLNKSSGMQAPVAAQRERFCRNTCEVRDREEELSNIRKKLYRSPHNTQAIYYPTTWETNKITWQLHQLMPHLQSLLH